MTALKTGQIQRTYVVADRGERPAVRGWFHLVAAALSAISSAVLITFGWMTLPWPQALGVTIYGAGVVLLFAVSAMYHRWPWRSPAAVQRWRRADHATTDHQNVQRILARGGGHPGDRVVARRKAHRLRLH